MIPLLVLVILLLAAAALRVSEYCTPRSILQCLLSMAVFFCVGQLIVHELLPLHLLLRVGIDKPLLRRREVALRVHLLHRACIEPLLLPLP